MKTYAMRACTRTSSKQPTLWARAKPGGPQMTQIARLLQLQPKVMANANRQTQTRYTGSSMCVVWSALRAEAANHAEFDIGPHAEVEPVEHVNLLHAQGGTFPRVEVIDHLEDTMRMHRDAHTFFVVVVFSVYFCFGSVGTPHLAEEQDLQFGLDRPVLFRPTDRLVRG
jgi:hypothetical protein